MAEATNPTNVNDWNRSVIEEFNANGGKAGGMFEGSLLLLLTSIGAKSGQPRINPLVYLPDGDRFVIFASKGGAPTHPDWYYNLIAHPEATIKVGTETFDVTATVATGELRDELYTRQTKVAPQFGDYQAKTTREIPVIILERRTV